MADITHRLFVRHLRSTPTTWVRHLRRGQVVREGTGLAFWFRPLSAALDEVPMDDRELTGLVHARTRDFQDVTVQTSLTYRVEDPVRAAARVDFSIDPATGRWRGTPLEQLYALLAQTAQQAVLDLLAGQTLEQTLAGGVGPVRDAAAAGLAADPRLADTGVHVVAVRAVSLRPQPDVEKALQTATRERIQQDADRATFERRAVAVERERAIGENELQTQIELARREQELVAQRGANARRQAEEVAAADAVHSRSQAQRQVELGESEATATRLLGEAQAAAEGARVALYAGLDPEVLLGLAVKELAAGLPQVQSLVLTPDLLAPVLAKLGAR